MSDGLGIVVELPAEVVGHDLVRRDTRLVKPVRHVVNEVGVAGVVDEPELAEPVAGREEATVAKCEGRVAIDPFVRRVREHVGIELPGLRLGDGITREERDVVLRVAVFLGEGAITPLVERRKHPGLHHVQTLLLQIRLVRGIDVVVQRHNLSARDPAGRVDVVDDVLVPLLRRRGRRHSERTVRRGAGDIGDHHRDLDLSVRDPRGRSRWRDATARRGAARRHSPGWHRSRHGSRRGRGVRADCAGSCRCCGIRRRRLTGLDSVPRRVGRGRRRGRTGGRGARQRGEATGGAGGRVRRNHDPGEQYDDDGRSDRRKGALTGRRPTRPQTEHLEGRHHASASSGRQVPRPT